MKNLFLISNFLLLTSFGFSQIPNYVPTAGLKLYMPFNFNINDESGNGNNGTASNTTFCLDRNLLPVSALDFAPASSQILINNLFDYSQKTVNLWIYAYSNTGGVIKSRHSSLLFGENTIYFYSNSLRMGYTDTVGGVGGGTQVFSNPTNTWVMLTYTRSSDSIRYYLNGLQNRSSPIGFRATTTSSSSLSTRIGSDGWGEFDGRIDDIGIWDRALTNCEISDLYNSQRGSLMTYFFDTIITTNPYYWPVNNKTYFRTGIYKDTLVNSVGCDSIVTLNLTTDYVGLKKYSVQSMNFSIYPNPTNSKLNIETDFHYSFIKIINSIGQTVIEIDRSNLVDVSFLETGNYIIQLLGEDNEVLSHQKFVKI